MAMIQTLRSLALLVAVAMATPAMASDGPAAAARAMEAAKALQTYSDKARAAGRRPDFAAAPAADLQRIVFDADSLAALSEPTAQDLPWLLDWSDAANRGFKQMALFGVPAGQRPDDATLTRNLQSYEDQIATALSFQLRVLAREMKASAMFMDELPTEQKTRIRLEGFRGMRVSAGGFLQSALCTAHDMNPANARIVMAAVKETRVAWINALYPEDRIKTMAWLKQMTEGDKEVADAAAVVLTAFAAEK
jgi:hypothetical protein